MKKYIVKEVSKAEVCKLAMEGKIEKKFGVELISPTENRNRYLVNVECDKNEECKEKNINIDSDKNVTIERSKNE